MDDKIREAFEREYSMGDVMGDAISMARREDGEYEQALARLCFKWFCKGQAALASKTQVTEEFTQAKLNANLLGLDCRAAFEKHCAGYYLKRLDNGEGDGFCSRSSRSSYNA